MNCILQIISQNFPIRKIKVFKIILFFSCWSIQSNSFFSPPLNFSPTQKNIMPNLKSLKKMFFLYALVASHFEKNLQTCFHLALLIQKENFKNPSCGHNASPKVNFCNFGKMSNSPPPPFSKKKAIFYPSKIIFGVVLELTKIPKLVYVLSHTLKKSKKI